MKIYFYLALFFSGLFSYGQNIVKGKVFLQENQKQIPALGVDVFWENTQTGTVTNAQGEFSLAQSLQNKTLVFSYLGFKQQRVTVRNSAQNIRVVLQPEASELQAVEVAYKRKPTEKLFTKTQNIISMGKEELLKAACCNLSESFETNTSVDVSVSDAVSGAKQIKMLGLSSPYLLMSQENMPFAYGVSQPYGLSFVPGTWVNSIQIIKGAGSVINGYQGVTGQINTELVKPMTDDAFFLNLYASPEGRKEFNAHLNGRVSDKWHTGFYVHTNYNNKRNDVNHDGFLDTPLARQLNVMNRWQYMNTDTGITSNILVNYVSDERTVGQVSYHPNEEYPLFSVWGGNTQIQQFNTMAKLGYIWDGMPYQSIGFQVNYKYFQQKSHMGGNHYNAHQHSAVFNVLFNSIISNTNHKFTTGINATLDDYQQDLKMKSLENLYKSDDYGAGAFFEYAFSGMEHLSLTAGLRADVHNRLGAFVTPRLHLRVVPWHSGVLRFSAGRAKRMAYVFAENQKMLATARHLKIDAPQLQQNGADYEIAWNYGVSFAQKFKIFNRNAEFSVDLYRTDFNKRVVVDWENPREVSVYQLSGKSFANSSQVEFSYEMAKELHLRTAYKYYDIQTDYASGRKQEPLQAKHRLFANLAYQTPVQKGKQWRFDYTLNWISPQRLPSTQPNPLAYQMPENTSAYVLSNAQITRVFSQKWEVYAGAENLFNYRQKNAILQAENPFGDYFDSSLVYAPVLGRMLYVGLRFSLKKF